MTTLLLFSAAALSAVTPLSLSEVYEPVVVGAPPMYAGTDMCVMPNGAIRHYGSEMHNGKVTRVYAETLDGGLNWKTSRAEPKSAGALFKSPWSDMWIGFTNRDSMGNRERRVLVARSKKGPEDTSAEIVVLPHRDYACVRLIPLVSRKRWLATFVELTCMKDGGYGAATAYSDDDGKTWVFQDLKPVKDVRRRNPGSARDHWFCSGTEPGIIEMKDGSILMCLRTSGPHAVFVRSLDGGATWSEPWVDERFWQANTRPEFLRLKDGRLIFVWNNTQLLPEVAPSLTPQGERGVAGFTNRDALHAAISDDDGKTWKGFREIALSEHRNSSDWRELGNDDAQEKDKSVHQTQMIEVAEGKVLIAYGQNISTRRFALFDPDWLLEKERSDNFQRGLKNISHHLYVRSASGGWRGWAGHCAWNRVPGAAMVLNPDIPYTARGDVLQLCRIKDPRLYSDRAGIVWNFPASKKGSVTVNARILGSGFKYTLSDHWINPCDEVNPSLQPVSENMTSADLPCRRPIVNHNDWYDVSIEWDCSKGEWRMLVNGKEYRKGALKWVPKAGFSYIHLQTLAEGTDPEGTHFRIFTKKDL